MRTLAHAEPPPPFKSAVNALGLRAGLHVLLARSVISCQCDKRVSECVVAPTPSWGSQATQVWLIDIRTPGALFPTHSLSHCPTPLHSTTIYHFPLHRSPTVGPTTNFGSFTKKKSSPYDWALRYRTDRYIALTIAPRTYYTTPPL